jgi:hypothetical protein
MACNTTALLDIMILLVVMTLQACGAACDSPDMQLVTVHAGGFVVCLKHVQPSPVCTVTISTCFDGFDLLVFLVTIITPS